MQIIMNSNGRRIGGGGGGGGGIRVSSTHLNCNLQLHADNFA